MSTRKYTDHAVVCDRCGRALWGSALRLQNGMTVKMVRDMANREGWVSRHEQRKMDDREGVLTDYCPQCAL